MGTSTGERSRKLVAPDRERNTVVYGHGQEKYYNLSPSACSLLSLLRCLSTHIVRDGLNCYLSLEILSSHILFIKSGRMLSEIILLSANVYTLVKLLYFSSRVKCLLCDVIKKGYNAINSGPVSDSGFPMPVVSYCSRLVYTFVFDRHRDNKNNELCFPYILHLTKTTNIQMLHSCTIQRMLFLFEG